MAAVHVNRNKYSDAWVALGQFPFHGQGEMRLSDRTSEAEGLRLKVCFDAVRWLRVA